MEFGDFMQMGLAGREDAKECPLKGQDAIDALRAGQKRWATEHTFSPGDLIVQKDGLYKIYRSGSRDTNPAIFIEYRSEFGPRDPDTYGEIEKDFDCFVGWLGPDGGMILSPVNSRHYEPYTP